MTSAPGLVLAREPRRQRLIEAVATVVAEAGYVNLTVARIVGEAHVSRRTFYDNFANPGVALVESHAAVADWLLAAIARRCRDEEDSMARVRMALEVVFGFAAREPRLAGLLTVDGVALDPELSKRIAVTSHRFVALLRKARRDLPRSESGWIEVSLVGGAAAVLTRYLAAGEQQRLDQLLPELSRWMLLSPI